MFTYYIINYKTDSVIIHVRNYDLFNIGFVFRYIELVTKVNIWDYLTPDVCYMSAVGIFYVLFSDKIFK